MRQTAQCRADVREEVVTLLLPSETVANENPVRIYPPDESDWRLVGLRYERVIDTANPHTLDLADASGNAAMTQIAVSAGLGARGEAVLSTDEARLHCHGKSGGNAYHVLTPGPTGNGGAFLIWVYYRKVQPSGQQSSARQS